MSWRLWAWLSLWCSQGAAPPCCWCWSCTDHVERVSRGFSGSWRTVVEAQGERNPTETSSLHISRSQTHCRTSSHRGRKKKQLCCRQNKTLPVQRKEKLCKPEVKKKKTLAQIRFSQSPKDSDFTNSDMFQRIITLNTLFMFCVTLFRTHCRMALSWNIWLFC